MRHRRRNIVAVAIIAAAATVTVATLAGPLDPPPGPITPSGTSLSEIGQSIRNVEDAVYVPLLAPTVGYQCAGIAPGGVTTSLQTLVTGSGVIKRIIVDVENLTTANSVELWVDGRFAGAYRAGVSSTSVQQAPTYDVNIAFSTSVQAKLRVATSGQNHSISVHYLPTP